MARVFEVFTAAHSLLVMVQEANEPAGARGRDGTEPQSTNGIRKDVGRTGKQFMTSVRPEAPLNFSAITARFVIC